jgi:hypothetical protein
MYKIPDVPSPQADLHEIADFIEIQCIRNKSISAREIFANLNRLEDHYYTDGVPEDDELEPKLTDTLIEIDNRSKWCGKRYPFRIDQHGYVVTFCPNINETIREIYTFLLFATRLDMKTKRIQNAIDGALLFEELSEYVGKHYFGEHAESYLFGTASPESNFDHKITSLIKRMGEGRGFKNRSDISPKTNKDGGLDMVVWKSFSDGCPGKLIGFGQCKTGTHWRDHLTILQPDSFCKKWFQDAPTVNPVRLFFISESILRSKWYNNSVDGGILFDRCRILDYFPVTDAPPFLSRIKAWNKAAREEIL